MNVQLFQHVTDPINQSSYASPTPRGQKQMSKDKVSRFLSPFHDKGYMITCTYSKHTHGTATRFWGAVGGKSPGG